LTHVLGCSRCHTYWVALGVTRTGGRRSRLTDVVGCSRCRACCDATWRRELGSLRSSLSLSAACHTRRPMRTSFAPPLRRLASLITCALFGIRLLVCARDSGMSSSATRAQWKRQWNGGGRGRAAVQRPCLSLINCSRKRVVAVSTGMLLPPPAQVYAYLYISVCLSFSPFSVTLSLLQPHTHTHRNTHNNKLRESSRVAFLKTQKLKCESVNVGEIIAQAKDEGRRRTRGLCFASDPSPTSCASCRQ
jgi:hypothetical protein